MRQKEVKSGEECWRAIAAGLSTADSVGQTDRSAADPGYFSWLPLLSWMLDTLMEFISSGRIEAKRRRERK